MTRNRTETLLLGHTSFIGRALSAELDRRGSAWRGLSSKELDLTGRDAAGRLARSYDPGTVVMLLSRVSRALPLWEQFEGDMAIAAKAAQALAARKAALFVFFSTSLVYGDGVTNLRITERTPAAPGSPYAVAKHAAERLLMHAAAQSGTPLLILRPSMVYGPGDGSTAYGPARMLRSSLAERKVALFGDGRERRDYLFISDLARAAVELARKGATGVFNVGTGKPRSFVEIASILERLVGERISIESLPRRTPKADQRLVVGKVRKALPRFAPLDLEQGLARTYRLLAQTRA